MSMLPIFLENYPVFEKLQEWSNAEQTRHWHIDLWKRKLFLCELSWITKDGGCAFIRKIAHTPQEAVWLTLEEAKKCD